MTNVLDRLKNLEQMTNVLDRLKTVERTTAERFSGAVAIVSRQTVVDAIAEIERLRVIVDRLPKTADGVPVAFDQTLFHVSSYDGQIEELKHTRSLSYWWIVEDCYDTREAAEAARAEVGE